MKELKKELSEKELEQVNAGFSGSVNSHDGIVGNCYYVHHDTKIWWFYGEMLETDEEDSCFGTTQRYHRFKILDQGNLPNEETYTENGEKHCKVYGRFWTIYTNKD